MRSQEEFRLSCVVSDYFRAVLPPFVLWTHFPAGEARNAVTGARLKRMGTQRGWPDYLVLHDGGVLAIELKAEKGKQSSEQMEFAERLTAIGGKYHVARSLDDVKAALADAGVATREAV